MFPTSVIIAAIAGGSVTALLLYVIARWRRRRWKGEETHQPLAELARRFRYWELFGMFLTYASIGLCWWGLVEIADVVMRSSNVVYRLTPASRYWLVAAFFVGILAATGPTHLLFRTAMGAARFAEFREYQTRKFGFDAHRWLFPFYLVFSAASAVFLATLFDWYVLFTPTEIKVNPFWSDTARHYSYDRVQEVRVATRLEDFDGTTLRRWAFVLYFDDGRRWSSRSDPSHRDERELQELADFILEKTGLPPVDISILERNEQ